jgi:hypothetical protein
MASLESKKKARQLLDLSMALFKFQSLVNDFAKTEPSAKRFLVDPLKQMDEYLDRESKTLGSDSFEGIEDSY